MTDMQDDRARAASIAPDAERIAAFDDRWRRKLGGSLSYLREVLKARGYEDLGRLDAAEEALRRGPVSPWTTGLYSELVAEASKSGASDVDAVLSELAEAAARPAIDRQAVAIDAPSTPAGWWAHFRRLIDTDAERNFQPVAPDEETAALCRREIAAGVEALERADPEFLAEVEGLMRLVVLAVPSSSDPTDGFGACSTYFMRETVVLNAASRRSAIEMVDTLVHETSHILLFGVALDEALTTDRGETRFESAARPDPRPLDGIFHAAFVSTRVHLALTRMLASGKLSAQETADAERRLSRNAMVASQTRDMVRANAALTRTGDAVFDAMERYWDAHGREADAA